jgi:hypothetical protein
MIQIIKKTEHIGVFDRDIVLTLAEIIAWGIKSTDPCWAEAYGADLAVDRAIQELEAVIPDAVKIINNILAPVPIYISVDRDYPETLSRFYELPGFVRRSNSANFPRNTLESEEFFEGLSISDSGFDDDGGQFYSNCEKLSSLFELAISRNASNLLSDVQKIKREVLA